MLLCAIAVTLLLLAWPLFVLPHHRGVAGLPGTSFYRTLVDLFRSDNASGTGAATIVRGLTAFGCCTMFLPAAVLAVAALASAQARPVVLVLGGLILVLAGALTLVVQLLSELSLGFGTSTRRRDGTPIALLAGLFPAACGVVAIVAGFMSRASTGWHAMSSEPITSTATIEVRGVHFTDGRKAFDATIARADRGDVVARLVDLTEGQTLADVGGDATFAANAGYFDEAFAPLGLYRIDGRDVAPLLARPPLSGVVTIDDVGRLDVSARDDAPAIARARSAFQAGPFVIDPGGAIGIRGDDGKLAERTVIAADQHSISVIVTSPTTLRALAECLHDRPKAFGLTRVERALNLDGGPSTGLVLSVDGKRLSLLPRGRIRSAIRFTVRP